jgi:polysaccharide biosynthesis transport protein
MSMFVDRHREALDQLGDVVRRRAALAVLVFVTLFAAGVAACLALPPLYRAVAVLAVEPGRGDPALPGELSARLDTISQTVLSRSPLLDQARRFGLYPELAARGLSDAVVEQMKSDIRVETKSTADPSGHGTLVGLNLSYRGRDPATAAQVSNSLAALYLEQDAQLRSQRYAGRAGLLKQRLAEMKERLDGHEARAADQRPPTPQGRGTRAAAEATALDRLSFQLRATREERMRALERREGLLKQLAETDPKNDVAARLARMRQDLVQRRQKLTERHPDVLQLEAEIAALEKESATPGNAPPSEGPAGTRLREALDETDAALRAMKRDEELLSQEMASVQAGLRAAPAAGMGEAPREYPAVQEIYGSLLRRYEDAQLADSAEETLASRLKLLDPAVPPLRDAGPPRLRLILFAAFGALSAAVAAGALAERLDRSFRSVDDLRAFTRVPVLATVPALLTARDRRRKRLLLGLSVTGAAACVTLLGLGSYHLFVQGYWLTAALERAR